jgi:protein SCO1
VISRKVVIGGHFELTDHHGHAVTDGTYRGKPMLLFFGFTHCKMVCPETLAKLSRALDRMGPVADGLQPLYVTVDPERDSPERMKAFLEASFPRFTGLTGPPAAIDHMKSLYKVWAERADRDADDGDDGDEGGGDRGYDVPHTAMTFLMAADGSYLTHFPNTATDAEIAGHVVELVGSSPR